MMTIIILRECSPLQKLLLFSVDIIKAVQIRKIKLISEPTIQISENIQINKEKSVFPISELCKH